jgi:thymidylate synthase (FAD)
MQIIEQGHIILTPLLHENIYGLIERAGRTAYKSESRITEDSAMKFIELIIARGHESVLEHASISVRFVTDRGVTHELVRHRLCAYTQESTRYCNYTKKGMAFVKPVFWADNSCEMALWREHMESCERYYNELIIKGAKPEQARTVLPNSLKTEIVCTANIREWRHIFRLRTSLAAHPQMRALMLPLLRELQEKLPILFGDLAI